MGNIGRGEQFVCSSTSNVDIDWEVNSNNNKQQGP